MTTPTPMPLAHATTVDNDVLAHMLLCAFRYALGRRTYITGTVSDWLIFYWPIIQTPWQQQIQEDILVAINRHDAGDDCDVKNWEKVLALPVSK
jgi:hypothetical protein